MLFCRIKNSGNSRCLLMNAQTEVKTDVNHCVMVSDQRGQSYTLSLDLNHIWIQTVDFSGSVRTSQTKVVVAVDTI